MPQVFEIKIFSNEDRLKVAAILVDNGYRVSQGKRKRLRSKSYDYFLLAEDMSSNNEEKTDE